MGAARRVGAAAHRRAPRWEPVRRVAALRSRAGQRRQAHAVHRRSARAHHAHGTDFYTHHKVIIPKSGFFHLSVPIVYLTENLFKNQVVTLRDLTISALFTD